jgi:hypothetical protein
MIPLLISNKKDMRAPSVSVTTSYQAVHPARNEFPEHDLRYQAISGNELATTKGWKGLQ